MTAKQKWYLKNKKRIRSDQKKYYQDNKEKIKAATKDWRTKNRNAFAINRRKYRAKLKKLCNDIKIANGCAICHEKEISCLDFHHLNGDDKEDSISNMASQGRFAEMIKEIKKCIILCSNCHRKLHAKTLFLPSNQTILIKLPKDRLSL